MDEWRPLIEAAEHAAADGNHQLAEDRLRELAGLQERRLGPTHPDLANTLNNLGIVSELLGKATEAERYFRRAVAMAVASRPADDPLVVTSRKNLEDFCAARGIAVDEAKPAALESPAPRVKPSLTPAAAKPSAPSAARPARHTGSIPPAVAIATESQSPRLAGAIIAAIVVAAAVLVYWVAFRGSGSNEQAPQATTSGPPPDPARPPAPPPAAPEKDPSQTAREAPEHATGAPQSTPAPTPVEPPPAPPTPSKKGAPGGIALVVARLCGSLGTAAPEWTCTPPADPVEPGRLTFYTRVRTPAATSIVHRWYRDGSLRQEVELAVSANTGAGFRTYSRHVVEPGSADWRIEVRTGDGTVLHEERFVVR
jgi:hypothetical protein